MKTLGGIIIAASVIGIIAVPVMGVPSAFLALGVAALVLWFVGIGAAAACVVPARPQQGIAALIAAILGVPLILAYGLAPLWGVMSAVCGLLVMGIPPRRLSRTRIPHTPR
jgi:hypothetical protein